MFTTTTCLDSWNSYASLVAYVEYTQARRAARCRCWDSSEEEGGPLRSREGEAWFGLTLSDSDGASEGRWRHGSLAKNPSSDDKRLGREHGMCHSVGAAGGSVGRTQASCPESLEMENACIFAENACKMHVLFNNAFLIANPNAIKHVNVDANM